jgi:hypothetical protein
MTELFIGRSRIVLHKLSAIDIISVRLSSCKRWRKKTPVNVNFREAAIRHFDDAEYLYANNRKANAGQLFGFCGECGIKALLVVFGLSRDLATGDLVQASQPYRAHIDGLIANLQNFAPSDPSYFAYCALMPSVNVFSNWSVDHRYYLEAAIPPSCAQWKAAAEEVRVMIDHATLDGKM